MTMHLQALASSARPLGDVLTDALRRQTNPLARLQGSDAKNKARDDSQPNLPLDDDASEERQEDVATALPPDEVAVAILLGRAFECRRGVLAKLLHSDAITIIHMPGNDYVDIAQRLLRRYILGTHTTIIDGDNLKTSSTDLAAAGSVALFVRHDSTKPKTSSAEFASAVQRGYAVIGIAAEPERLLPRDLVRLADTRIAVPPLDAAAIAAVIVAITGKHPGPIDEHLGKRATLEHLTVAVRADFGAHRCVERLQRLVDIKDADTTPLLSDLHGLGEAKDWGLALIHDLKENRAGRLPASEIPKGCLLSGPPGTGKTSFARSLAKEAGVHFVATSYSQWQSSKDGHLGSVTAAIRASFAEAARNQPAILFIDEIDSIPTRGASNRYDEWWTAVVNTVLEQMDGFDRHEGVCVIGATNSPAAKLDPALVRAGRLDKHVQIPMPDTPALAGILRTHLGEDLKGIDLLPGAVAARGGTGADVEHWVRIARRTARIAQRSLTLDDVVTAIRDGKTELPVQVRHRIAYHESGHMVALIFLGIAEPHAMSIHTAGGLSEFSPGPIEAQTRAYVQHHMTCLLAGRAAEELVFGDVTAGAGGSEGSDLSRATQLALRIETSFGLGDFGQVWIGDAAGQRALLLHDGLSQTVRRTLDTAYAAAKTLLIGNRDTLDHLAAALLARGYLGRGEIEAILAKAPLRICETTDSPAVQTAQPSDPQGDKTEIDPTAVPDTTIRHPG